MVTSTDLQRVTSGLKLLESQEQRQHLIDTFDRLKNSTPFSQRLNDFIERWYDRRSHVIKFVETDDFDENDIQGTFIHHLDRLATHNIIHVWTGASENTIFGDPTINHKFRAWHDYTHLLNKVGYDSVGESIVADIQKNELPSDWLFERELLHIEVVGQIHYHALHGDFVDDQRLFTARYLNNPLKALK